MRAGVEFHCERRAGPKIIETDGILREFFGYFARGAPLGPDHGTVSPWAAVSSLPLLLKSSSSVLQPDGTREL
jgi:hypothetical protein